MRHNRLPVVWLVATSLIPAATATPFASTVESYDTGTGAGAGYTDPTTALGSPERFTGEGVFPGAVTPFNAPFGTDEVVSIGEGGSLVVGFDAPVFDDPDNPYGVDLLIFGNAFYFDADFPNGIVAGLGSEGGLVEVSQNGSDWHLVPGVEADGAFPTLGYQDLTGPFDSNPGTVPTDFLKPVDPSFDPTGLSFAQVVAGYDGSGGGAGVDLADVGLPWIQYVRVSNPVGSGVTPEIDAFARVPSPGALGVMLAGALVARRRGAR